MALMEAAEKLIKENFTPENDIYFAFGHDEEVGGTQGAKKISEYFEENNIKLDAVYDEGGLVISGAVSGVSSPIALVGTAEKGYCDVELSISAYGGHSSTPPKETALGIISKIINSIEKNPMAASLSSPVKEMLSNICHEMGFAVKMAVANLWLFKPVLFKLFSGSTSTNAMVRTTIVPTVINAGEAANVIPQNAKCIFNIRLIPGDSGSDVLNHIKNLSKRYNALLTLLTIEESSKISPTNTEGYNKLISSIKKFYPNAIPTPYLVMGGTDARKYYNVCDNIYRFTPIWITDEEKDTMHSHNESISVENYLRMIDFFEIMFKK
jgi:carboxypeptidase PM20D1